MWIKLLKSKIGKWFLIQLKSFSVNLNKSSAGDYEIYEIIGSGTFADVYRGKHKATGQQ